MPDRLIDLLRSGTLRDQLQAMRDFLAEALEYAPPREQAPIAAQLRQVLIDLDAMPVGEKESTVDEIARARAARRALAAAEERPAV